MSLQYILLNRTMLTADFREMPLDILYEVSDSPLITAMTLWNDAQIFGHLRPYDLLRLARTTKALRNILLRRSAKSVWKDALANIEGLPVCPDDLNEPQFASLAFDPFCHVRLLVLRLLTLS